MADRKKERKGARKKAASKPKAAARVAASVGPMGRLPTGGGWGELTQPVPFEGMSGTGAIVPVPSDQPPPQRPQADEAILRARELLPPQAARRTHNAPSPAEEFTSISVNTGRGQSQGMAETTVIRAAPALRPGWEASQDEVLSRAAEVVDLYQRLWAILAPAMPAPGSPGHNRRSILEEGLAELRDYQATAELATELFQERARPSDPDTKVIKQSGNVFKTLVHGTQAFGVTVSRWIAEGLVKGEVVKYAPGLVAQLVGALRTLAEVIASLFQ
jgi:hypothetical protein